MEESHNINIEGQRSHTKQCILYHSIYMKLKNSKTIVLEWDSGIIRGRDALFLGLDSGYINVFIMWNFTKWHI